MAQRNPNLLREFGWTTKKSLENQADVSLTLANWFQWQNPTRASLFLKATSVDELNYIYSHIVHLIFANGSLPGGPSLSIANFVWLEQSLFLKPSFKQVLDTIYKASCQQVDFMNKAEEVRNLVNSWVETQTRSLVKQILPPDSVDSDTKLILANAIYFKGEWSCEFDASRTRNFDFHLLNGYSIQVPFMTRNEKRQLSAFDGFKVLKLPYKQGGNQSRAEPSFSMYIYLPNSKYGLPALVERAGSEPGFLDRYIPYQEINAGMFWIPKFKFEYEIELSGVLESLELVLPFKPEAGFREMVGCYPLVVSKIFHKSFIEVDESGTEAAAATVAVMGYGCCATRVQEFRIDFVADHPFLYVIREDQTGIVQFIGQVLNPSTT
ncbi:Serpin-ZX [Heracleum sosnowskyi]|uniref:Serpin-ZX n=1 Tax=Heracleum sosnowskyi TaxID=360622 RepID=A0AAD8J4C1_9APIA|nr:Serpin-ZX [Heracleum sosnowskyi]